MSKPKKTATKKSAQSAKRGEKPRGVTQPQSDLAHAQAGEGSRKPTTAEELQKLLREEIRIVIAHKDEVSPGVPGATKTRVVAPGWFDTTASGGRLVVTAGAGPAYDGQLAQPGSIGHWFVRFLNQSPEAMLEAAAELCGYADPADLEANTLSALGALASKAVRRRILLAELQAADWNLSAVSETLRMGGAGNVTKAIKDLGLERELAAARAAGKARPGGRR